MLICPVITIFYIDIFGDYNLKMSKISILFWQFSLSCQTGGHIVYDAIGKTPGDYLKMSKIDQFFS